jgi:hypothetical protein
VNAEYEKNVEAAKKIHGAVARALLSPGVLVLPQDIRAALGALAPLIVELARLSHAKFDMSPYDSYPELVRRVESLEAFKLSIIRKESNDNGNR